MPITIPQSGNQIAAPQQRLQVSGSNPVNDALGRMAGVGLQAGISAVHQDAENAERRRNAEAALQLAKTTNDLHTAQDDVSRGVLDGSIPTDKAGGEFKKRVDKISTDTLGGYAPEQRMVMDSHLAGVVGGLDRQLTGVVMKRQQQETAGTIDQFGEQVSREAMRQGPGWATQKYGAFVDFTGPAAGLNPENQAKLKQQFGERVTHDFYLNAGTAALTSGNAVGVRSVREQVEGAAGESMDPAKRTQLVHQLFGWEQSMLAHQDRLKAKEDDEGRKRYNEAVDVYNKGTEIAMGGGYLSPEFITEMTTASAGTAMSKPVLDLIASQRTISGFAARTAPERAAILAGMREGRATPGVGVDPLGDKLLSAATKLDENLRREADENPWKAAQQAGRIQQAPQLNPASPQQAVEVLQQRMKDISSVEQWAGKRVSPFQPEEIEQVGKMVRALPVDQAATMLSRFGEVMGNQERVAVAAKQLHDKDGTLGLAMMFANAQTTEGRTTAELVLRGAQAEKDGAVKPDGMKETGWKATIAKQVRGAYSNRDAEDQVVRAAYLIAGASEGDVDRAVRLATGGIIDFNGGKVPMPYGMAADGQSSGEKKFRTAIDNIQALDIMPQALSGNVRAGPALMSVADFARSLPEARLVHGGQGVYYVRAGNTLVTNEDGAPIALKIAP